MFLKIQKVKQLEKKNKITKTQKHKVYQINYQLKYMTDYKLNSKFKDILTRNYPMKGR